MPAWELSLRGELPNDHPNDPGRRLGEGWKAVGLPVSPAATPTKHHGRREQHDLEVLPRRPVADVLEIVAQLLADIVHAAVVRPVDLGPAGDSGQDALAPMIFLDLVAQGHKDRGLLRARSHDVHIAHQYVPELRQLVEPELAQHATHRGHARIVALRPDLARRSAVHVHRAKLVHDERPAAAVSVAPEIAPAVADRATIETDPLLREQHRAPGRKLDQYGDCSHQRQGEHQRHRRNDDVETTPTRVAALRCEGDGPSERTELRQCHARVELGRVPSPHTPALSEEQAGPDWRRVASALLRFKWVVVLMVMLGLGGAFAATRVLRPIYRAQANVWVDVPDPRGNGGSDTRGPIRQGALLDADAWVELLRSYIVLDQVVRDMHLYVEVKRPSDRPSFDGFGVSESFRPGDYRLTVGADGKGYTLASAEGVDLGRGTLGDSIGNRVGFRWAPPPGSLPPGRTIEFALVPPRDAALRLGEQLDVRMDLNGNFLALELRGPNPVLISSILNAVAQRYVEVAAQLKRQKLTELTKILEDQLTTAQRNLDSAETALQQFRTRTITLPSDQPANRKAAAETRDPVRASFFDMAVERDELRRDRDAIDRLLAGGSGGDGLPTEALSVIGSVQHAPELSSALKELSDKQAQMRMYRYHYSEAYPPLQRLAREISELQQRTIPTLARALSTQLAARESELGRQVDAASRDLRQIPGRTLEDARLSRNAELKEQTYTALQQRFDQARLAAEATVPDVRILDPAVVPQRPVKIARHGHESRTGRRQVVPVRQSRAHVRGRRTAHSAGGRRYPAWRAAPPLQGQPPAGPGRFSRWEGGPRRNRAADVVPAPGVHRMWHAHAARSGGAGIARNDSADRPVTRPV